MCNKLNLINHHWTIEEIFLLKQDERKLLIHKINKYLQSLTATERIRWAKNCLPSQFILSSSFGIYSAVSLNLITRYYSDIPVVVIDTGYLFPETYKFINRLTQLMGLNLHVFRAKKSAAWQEAEYGKLWEQGIEGLNKYNFINKIEPMNFALKKLNVKTWFAGLRNCQSYSRRNLPIIDFNNGFFKFLPIVDWDNNTVDQYIQRYSLEYHPLKQQGYVSVGDTHTTVQWKPGMKEEETRFFGLKRECGLHLIE